MTGERRPFHSDSEMAGTDFRRNRCDDESDLGDRKCLKYGRYQHERKIARQR